MIIEKWVINYFKKAGITINGPNDYDLQVVDKRFYKHLFFRGSIGLGESYMYGWWNSKRLDKLMHLAFKKELDLELKRPLPYMFHLFINSLKNPMKKSLKDIQSHYDKDLELYTSMLDKNLIYTGGYYKNAKTLDQAQRNKLDMICKKLKLKKGMTLLDIGCGFGGLLKFASEKYGVKGVGITLSKIQFDYATKNCKGLPITIRLEDYRSHQGRYDRIVSLGMFEHVGKKWYGAYYKKVDECLKDDGIFLLETLGVGKSIHKLEPWLEKYIFPGAYIPSPNELVKPSEGKLILEDWHNFGKDYDATLLAWHTNFIHRYKKGSKIFRRLWEFYLLSSAGSLRAHRYMNWQVIFTKYSSDKGYVR